MATAGMPACAGCTGCDALLRVIEELRAEIAKLQAKIAALEKNSSTSSKPPSSDFGRAKPKAKEKKDDAHGKRKRGAQPGHEAHWRQPFDDADVKYSELVCTECPDCHGPLTPSKQPPKVIQQVELPLPSQMISIVGVRSHAGWCRKCKQVHYTPFDNATTHAGLTGPRLTALIGYLKGACHASYSTIKRFVRDLFGIKISRGYLAKVVAKVSGSMADAYDDLANRLPFENI